MPINLVTGITAYTFLNIVCLCHVCDHSNANISSGYRSVHRGMDETEIACICYVPHMLCMDGHRCKTHISILKKVYHTKHISRKNRQNVAKSKFLKLYFSMVIVHVRTTPDDSTLLRYSRKPSSLISWSVKMKVMPLPCWPATR